MRLLLDTHVFLWWNEANPRLSRRVKTLLSDPKNQLLLSVASAWELVVKIQTGKLKLPQPVGDYLPARLAYYGVEVLPLRLDHALALHGLPAHHRDPFDRMLVAQALVEDLPIVTRDPQLGLYSATIIW